MLWATFHSYSQDAINTNFRLLVVQNCPHQIPQCKIMGQQTFLHSVIITLIFHLAVDTSCYLLICPDAFILMNQPKALTIVQYIAGSLEANFAMFHGYNPSHVQFRHSDTHSDTRLHSELCPFPVVYMDVIQQVHFVRLLFSLAMLAGSYISQHIQFEIVL